jgi:hypothetical protein
MMSSKSGFTIIIRGSGQNDDPKEGLYRHHKRDGAKMMSSKRGFTVIK